MIANFTLIYHNKKRRGGSMRATKDPKAIMLITDVHAVL